MPHKMDKKLVQDVAVLLRTSLRMDPNAVEPLRTGAIIMVRLVLGLMPTDPKWEDACVSALVSLRKFANLTNDSDEISFGE